MPLARRCTLFFPTLDISMLNNFSSDNATETSAKGWGSMNVTPITRAPGAQRCIYTSGVRTPINLPCGGIQ